MLLFKVQLWSFYVTICSVWSCYLEVSRPSYPSRFPSITLKWQQRANLKSSKYVLNLYCTPDGLSSFHLLPLSVLIFVKHIVFCSNLCTQHTEKTVNQFISSTSNKRTPLTMQDDQWGVTAGRAEAFEQNIFLVCVH